MTPVLKRLAILACEGKGLLFWKKYQVTGQDDDI